MGGVCLFATNVSTPAQAQGASRPRSLRPTPTRSSRSTRRAATSPACTRRRGLRSPATPCWAGSTTWNSPVRWVLRWAGSLRDVGVNLTLAPDVDVNSNASNPVIGVRSFGASPALVGEHGVAWTQGVQSTGVAANAKHFPGHGDTAQDSHVSLPTVDVDAETLASRELAPFAAAIAGGVASIMSSHIMVPAIDPVNPATFSHAILDGLLRGQMGFEGAIVSDALDMVGASGELGIPAAAARALAAGCDLLCIGTANTDAQMDQIVAAIEGAMASGDVTEERLADAAARIGRLVASTREAPAAPADLVRGEVPGLTSARIRDSFYVSEAALSGLEAREGAPVAWVCLEPAANIAVGPSPWGPFASAVEADAVVTPEHGLGDWAPREGRLVVVVGKDNHRHAWAREAIDALRVHGAIVVDMGWPSLEDGYADIATYGASRAVGAALLELLQ
nr:glycoside hydrolase family 3 N-terminal domain-containing protein [Demequina litorisediminis]